MLPVLLRPPAIEHPHRGNRWLKPGPGRRQIGMRITHDISSGSQLRDQTSCTGKIRQNRRNDRSTAKPGTPGRVASETPHRLDLGQGMVGWWKCGTVLGGGRL